MSLEVMEEVICRRWHSGSAIECTGILSAITAKLQAPGMKILWTAATANIPEHWHTFRDLPNIIEREAMALYSARALLPDGTAVKAFDGFLTIFGIDLNQNEWRFFRERVELGNGFEVQKNLGLGILWSDEILREHTRRGEIWPIYPVVTQLHYSALPVQTGCRIDSIENAKDISAFLLVDPIGLTDAEFEKIRAAVERGARLVVTGRVEHEGLRKLLGIDPARAAASGKWRLEAADELWLRGIPETGGAYQPAESGFVCDGARAIVSDGNRALVAEKGGCVYLGATRSELPNFDMPKSRAELDCDQPVFERRAEPATSVRKAMQIAATYHPDCLELIEARVVADRIGIPMLDKGQMYGFEKADGRLVVLLENCMTPMYIVTEVKLKGEKACVNELPVRRLGPLGYIYWDHCKDSFTVSVPPDAAIPCVVQTRDGSGNCK